MYGPQTEDRLNAKEKECRDKDCVIDDMEKTNDASTSKWKQVVDKKMLNEEALRLGK